MGFHGNWLKTFPLKHTEICKKSMGAWGWSMENVEVEVYFDEAGNTGDNLRDETQRNLFLAAISIPEDVRGSFWKRARAAWKLAAALTGTPMNGLELKGEQIYGGKGNFAHADLKGRCRLLDEIFSALVSHGITVFWEGLPKHRWLERVTEDMGLHGPKSLWPQVLFAFCNELCEVLPAVYQASEIAVVGDGNPWIGPERLLKLLSSDNWTCLLDGGIAFLDSKDVPGLQLADIVVHTLYRANKEACPAPNSDPVRVSNTDRIAFKYHKILTDAGLCWNLGSVRTSLSKIVAAQRMD
jgi:hypothetical protein